MQPARIGEGITWLQCVAQESYTRSHIHGQQMHDELMAWLYICLHHVGPLDPDEGCILETRAASLGQEPEAECHESRLSEDEFRPC